MQLTADIIAQHIGGTVEGDGSVAVNDFAKIESGRPGTISFLANPKYTHHLYTTEASVVLVRRDFVAEHPVRATLIRVEDPYAALAQLLNLAAALLKPNPVGIEEPVHVGEGTVIPEGAYIGAFAYIGKGVKLGQNVKIYPQSYIGDGVEIGDDTILYAGVKVYYGCRIGSRCIVHSGAVIGSDGFGFAPDAQGVYHKIEQLGIVNIEDDVEIGANTTIDRSTMGTTHICRGVKLDNLIQVAHNVVIGHDTAIAAQAGMAGSSKVGANCMIGGQVGIAGHISIGDRTAIGAQSGIPNNVAPDSRLMGYPAVPMADFARNAVYLKRLAELYKRVGSIEKAIKDK